MDRRVKNILTLDIVATIGVLALNWWFIKIHPVYFFALAFTSFVMFAIVFLGITMLINKAVSKVKKKYALFLISEGVNGIVFINTFILIISKAFEGLKIELNPIITIICILSFIVLVLTSIIGIDFEKKNNLV